MSDFDPWQSAVVASDVWGTGLGTGAAIRARQRRRLASLLAAARRRTRLHAERLHDLDPDVALGALPVMSKDLLMARFDDSVGDPGLNLAGVREFVADPGRIGTPYLGRYVVWDSSGSSGRPALFVQDAAAMAVYDALEALRPPRRAWAVQPPGRAGGVRWMPPWADPVLLLDAFGLNPLSARQCFVGAIEGHFASQVSLQRLRRLNPWLAATLGSFSIMQPLPALVAQLNDWQPTVLATYPTAAALLAGEQRRGALRLRLREVLTGGETLAPAQREHIESSFDCALRDSYGASEFLTIGSECAHRRMHVNADWVILEAVDADGRPVPPGTLSHTTLLTNLANHVQPLIRYDLGDRIRFLQAPCPCGSALPVIEVLGRCDDAVVMQGRGGRAVVLLPLALCTVLEEEADVFDFQIRQLDRRTLALRLGGSAPDAAGRLQRCHAALQAYARSQGMRSLRIVDEAGDGIPCGRSGKVQRVVARFPQEAVTSRWTGRPTADLRSRR